jgi:hypothetical protein
MAIRAAKRIGHGDIHGMGRPIGARIGTVEQGKPRWLAGNGFLRPNHPIIEIVFASYQPYIGILKNIFHG